jgi:hypothetical protein
MAAYGRLSPSCFSVMCADDVPTQIGAWEMSSSILMNTDVPDALKTLAAQTLKTKVGTLGVTPRYTC